MLQRLALRLRNVITAAGTMPEKSCFWSEFWPGGMSLKMLSDASTKASSMGGELRRLLSSLAVTWMGCKSQPQALAAQST